MFKWVKCALYFLCQNFCIFHPVCSSDVTGDKYCKYHCKRHLLCCVFTYKLLGNLAGHVYWGWEEKHLCILLQFRVGCIRLYSESYMSPYLSICLMCLLTNLKDGGRDLIFHFFSPLVRVLHHLCLFAVTWPGDSDYEFSENYQHFQNVLGKKNLANLLKVPFKLSVLGHLYFLKTSFPF